MPGCPAPEGQGAEGSLGVCPAEGILLLTADGATVPGVDMEGHHAPLGLVEGSGRGPKPPRGLHRQLCDSNKVFKCLYRQPKNN